MAWMTLGHMRKDGCRTVEATCSACGHTGAVNVDTLPDDMPIPFAADKLRCSECGSRKIETKAAVRGQEEPATPPHGSRPR